MVGLLWRQGTGHGRYHPFDVHVVDHNHPITSGMDDLRMHPDELYHRLVHKDGARYRVLMSAYSDPKTGGTGRHEPMATVGAFGAGRVFHTPLGHVWRNNVPSRATWADPQLRLLLARGCEWAATGAVTLGATPLNRVSKAEAAQGFVALFDGKEISAWTAYRRDEMPPKGWVVRDAAIVHEKAGGGGDLVSREMYGDFDFRFSFRVAKGANSGVMWHVTDAGQQTYFTGPEYQVFLGGYRDPVTKSADVEVDYVAMGYPTTAKNVDGDAFRIGGVQPLVFVMRSGDEVLYISTKYSVSVGPNGAGGMSHQVTSYPDFYRYRFKALAEKVGGPVEVALDFQTGWVWVIPVLDGAPDPSRIAIAIFHSANDSNAPRIRGFEITP